MNAPGLIKFVKYLDSWFYNLDKREKLIALAIYGNNNKGLCHSMTNEELIANLELSLINEYEDENVTIKKNLSFADIIDECLIDKWNKICFEDKLSIYYIENDSPSK